MAVQDGLGDEVDAIYIGSLPVHVPTEDQEVLPSRRM